MMRDLASEDATMMEQLTVAVFMCLAILTTRQHKGNLCPFTDLIESPVDNQTAILKHRNQFVLKD